MLLAPVVLPATHAQTVYTQPTSFERPSAHVDILIIPPAYGQLVHEGEPLGGEGALELTPFNSYVTATRNAVADLVTAIDTFGPEWMQGQVTLNTWVIGQDDIPAEALADPDIRLVYSPFLGPYAGVAPSIVSGGDPTVCTVFVATNVGLSMTYNALYSVAGHEVAHCLGLDHIAGDEPDEDLMESAVTLQDLWDPEWPRRCPSNLNVAGLAITFGSALGHPAESANAHVAPQDYAKIAC